MSTTEQACRLTDDPLFNIRRVFGLETFEITVKNRISKPVVCFKRSVTATIYTVLVAVFIVVIWINEGLCITSAFPSVNILILNLNFLTIFQRASSLISLICSCINQQSRKDILQMYLDIDSKLFHSPQEYYNKCSKYTLLAVGVAFADIVGHFSFDMWVTGDHFGFNRITSASTYVIHWILIVVAMNYAYCVLQVLQRVIRLNLKICEVTDESCPIQNANSSNKSTRISPTGLETEQSAIQNRLDLNSSAEPSRNDTTLPVDFRDLQKELFTIRELYEKVYKCIILTNNAFGIQPFLVIFSSCIDMIHCICFAVYADTSYLPHQGRVICIMLMWSLLHSCGMICIILPCKAAKKEVMKTLSIIEELLGEPPPDEEVLEQLNLLHDQISSREFSFSAGGIYNIDFPMMGSLALSVASYLLVLIQICPPKHKQN